LKLFIFELNIRIKNLYQPHRLTEVTLNLPGIYSPQCSMTWDVLQKLIQLFNYTPMDKMQSIVRFDNAFIIISNFIKPIYCGGY